MVLLLTYILRLPYIRLSCDCIRPSPDLSPTPDLSLIALNPLTPSSPLILLTHGILLILDH